MSIAARQGWHETTRSCKSLRQHPFPSLQPRNCPFLESLGQHSFPSPSTTKLPVLGKPSTIPFPITFSLLSTRNYVFLQSLPSTTPTTIATSCLLRILLKSCSPLSSRRYCGPTAKEAPVIMMGLASFSPSTYSTTVHSDSSSSTRSQLGDRTCKITLFAKPNSNTRRNFLRSILLDLVCLCTHADILKSARQSQSSREQITHEDSRVIIL